MSPQEIEQRSRQADDSRRRSHGERDRPGTPGIQDAHPRGLIFVLLRVAWVQLWKYAQSSFPFKLRTWGEWLTARVVSSGFFMRGKRMKDDRIIRPGRPLA
jgi:hypothetical protein